MTLYRPSVFCDLFVIFCNVSGMKEKAMGSGVGNDQGWTSHSLEKKVSENLDTVWHFR